MYPPFFFGSTYITLMTQNSKTIRIIFLPKSTQKNCAFYVVFYTFFLHILVLSGKTKSALAMIFSGYFHIDRPWLVSPRLILRKFARRGPSVFCVSFYRDYLPPRYYSSFFNLLNCFFHAFDGRLHIPSSEANAQTPSMPFAPQISGLFCLHP